MHVMIACLIGLRRLRCLGGAIIFDLGKPNSMFFFGDDILTLLDGCYDRPSDNIDDGMMNSMARVVNEVPSHRTECMYLRTHQQSP